MTNNPKKHLSVKELIIILCLLGFVISLAFFLGWRLGYQGLHLTFLQKDARGLTDIKRVYNIIRYEFDGAFDSARSSSYTIEKLVETLQDPHSYYVTKEEYKEYKEEERGEFIGIGIVYVVEHKTPLILEVLPGSPAETSGLKIGERIVQINDLGVEKFNEVELINQLKGQEGEIVRLRILDGKEKSRKVTIKREKFKIPNITFKLMENEVGYLKIYQFSPTLKEEFYPILQELKNYNSKKLVIDLRNNIGGDINMAVFIADQFIKEGVLVREKSKKTPKESVQKASGNALLQDYEIAVLVNYRTASAAEVLAAAIKDNARGKILGEKTKGKASEQTFFELNDGSAICLTIGKWLTPKSEWLEGKGIEPDIKITEKKEGGDDPILKKAIEILQTSEAK